MKILQWLILGGLGLCVVALVFASGFLSGDTYSMLSYTPEIVVATVEIPVIVTQEVIVTKEILVTPVPTEEIIVTESPVAMESTEEPCYDSAWVSMQPQSNISTNGLKVGTIKRLHFRLRNEGSCIWNGYVLSSGGVLPDIPVPVTYPGETADVVYDFQVYKPIVARWVLKPPTNLYGISEPLLMSNSASPGVGLETIYYELEVAPETPKLPGCGPYGCRAGNWRYR